VAVEKKINEEFSRFEAIIELLFGDQIRKYDTKIEQMNKHIKKLEKELIENKKDYNNKLQLLSAEMAGNISNLDDTITGKMKDKDRQANKRIIKLEENMVDKKILAERLNLLVDVIIK